MSLFCLYTKRAVHENQTVIEQMVCVQRCKTLWVYDLQPQTWALRFGKQVTKVVQSILFINCGAFEESGLFSTSPRGGPTWFMSPRGIMIIHWIQGRVQKLTPTVCMKFGCSALNTRRQEHHSSVSASIHWLLWVRIDWDCTGYLLKHFMV